MRRLHIHVNSTETDFDKTVSFYATLFGSAPTKTRTDYAKWMLDEPKVNFVVEVLEIEGDVPGIHHVGMQVDDSEELAAIKEALKAAEAPLLEIGETICCFSKSEKNWTIDPNGVRWETFRSFGDVEDYGAKTDAELANYANPSVLEKR